MIRENTRFIEILTSFLKWKKNVDYLNFFRPQLSSFLVVFVAIHSFMESPPPKYLIMRVSGFRVG